MSCCVLLVHLSFGYFLLDAACFLLFSLVRYSLGFSPVAEITFGYHRQAPTVAQTQWRKNAAPAKSAFSAPVPLKQVSSSSHTFGGECLGVLGNQIGSYGPTCQTARRPQCHFPPQKPCTLWAIDVSSHFLPPTSSVCSFDWHLRGITKSHRFDARRRGRVQYVSSWSSCQGAAPARETQYLKCRTEVQA